MPTIEELDEKVSYIKLEAAKAKPAPTNGAASDSADDNAARPVVGAALPDAIKDVRERSFDDRFEELNRIPLFMRHLDESDGRGGSNVELDALKSLAYDGEPWEVALQLKENGNECFARKEYVEAVEYYTQALQLDCGRSDVDETCHANRAACHLELQNYGKALYDCSRALRINEKNVKALYRSARACVAVERLDEAQDAIARGLKLDPTNKPLLKQLDLLENRIKAQISRQKEEDSRKALQTRHKHNLDHALRIRSVTLVKTANPPDLPAGSELQLSDPDDTTSALQMPCVLLYPLAYQSDFLARVYEVDTISDQLSTVLSDTPPWDTEHEYTPEAVDVFVETRRLEPEVAGKMTMEEIQKTSALIKCAPQTTITQVLANPKIDLVDGVLRLFVVPRAKSKDWISAFKAERVKTTVRA